MRIWRVQLGGMASLLLLVEMLAPPRAQARPPSHLTIAVDATEAARHILHAHVSIPVDRKGTVTLHYPRWLPGAHGPVIPIADLAGLVVRGNGHALKWRRDDIDLSSFHVEVPAGLASIEVDLDHLATSPAAANSTTTLSSERLALIDWAFLLVYPDGIAAHDLQCATRLRLPAGWTFATALDSARSDAKSNESSFAPVSLEQLVDSPVLAGAALHRFELGTFDGAAHEVDVVADGAELIEPPAETLAAWKKLPAEALALFGVRHYRAYHFLLALSDQQRRPSGLEHHESSDNRAPGRSLIDELPRRRLAGLLPHEMVHSWNGKFRRPAGLATPDYHQPMRDELLWVYEGLTSYLGEVLTARSGLRTPELAREALALTAAEMEWRAGRAWRPLQDTAIAAATGRDVSEQWVAWRRGLDYYGEGVLLWLEVDTALRAASNGQRSLDDVARAFFGGEKSGPPEVKPYQLDDLIGALDAVGHRDWRSLLRARLDETASHAPLGGLTASGWRLVYSDSENAVQLAAEAVSKSLWLRTSLGLTLREDGTILDVNPGQPAAKAGAAPGMKVRAVNGRRFTPEGITTALRATASGPGGLELLVENDDWFRTLKIDYRGGLKVPHLERIPSTVDVLTAIFAARAL